MDIPPVHLRHLSDCTHESLHETHILCYEYRRQDDDQFIATVQSDTVPSKHSNGLNGNTLIDLPDLPSLPSESTEMVLKSFIATFQREKERFERFWYTIARPIIKACHKQSKSNPLNPNLTIFFDNLWQIKAFFSLDNLNTLSTPRNVLGSLPLYHQATLFLQPALESMEDLGIGSKVLLHLRGITAVRIPGIPLRSSRRRSFTRMFSRSTERSSSLPRLTSRRHSYTSKDRELDTVTFLHSWALLFDQPKIFKEVLMPEYPQQVSDATRTVKEMVAIEQERAALSFIEHRIVRQSFTLISGSVRLKREGMMMKVNRHGKLYPVYLVLLNNVLLYFHIQQNSPSIGRVKETKGVSAPLFFKRKFVLCECEIVKNMGTQLQYEHSFLLKSPQKTFVLCATSPQERSSWISAIQAAIAGSKLNFSSISIDDPSSPSQTSIAPLWVPDKDIETCMLCDRPFSLLKRRHHCRKCGRVVCRKCSEGRRYLENISDGKPLRTCDICEDSFCEPNRKIVRNETPSASSPLNLTLKRKSDQGLGDLDALETAHKNSMITLVNEFLVPLKSYHLSRLHPRMIAMIACAEQIVVISAHISREVKSYGNIQIYDTFHQLLHTLYIQFAKHHTAASFSSKPLLPDTALAKVRHDALQLGIESFERYLAIPIEHPFLLKSQLVAIRLRFGQSSPPSLEKAVHFATALCDGVKQVRTVLQNK